MRKAFTLLEVLVLVTVMPLLMVILSKVFAVFIHDIPQETRLLQENTTVLNLLQQISRDMDEAIDLPGPYDANEPEVTTLRIVQPKAVICYEFRDGQVVRTQPQERIWRVPDAVIAWRLWGRNGKPYAVEVHARLQYRFEGRLRPKLVNSHVYFVGGLGRGGDLQ